MSEKTDWKKDMKELLNPLNEGLSRLETRINDLEKKVLLPSFEELKKLPEKRIKTEQPVKQPEAKPIDIAEHVKTCKDCYVDVYNKVYKPLEFECEECGLPVRIEEEKCPGCGSKRARKRR